MAQHLFPVFAQILAAAVGGIWLIASLKAFPQDHVETFRIQLVFSAKVEMFCFGGPIGGIVVAADYAMSIVS